MSRSATLVFHGELCDDLPPGADGDVTAHFELPVGVRDLIQSVGLPHVEVGALQVNGVPAGFEHKIDDGDCIDVFPRFGRCEVRHELHGTVPHRFVLDAHLGRLARYLRLLGFDTWHRPSVEDDELVAISLGEGRTLLTRDRELLKRAAVEHGCLVRATDPRRQVDEIVRRLELSAQIRPFSRCLVCNGVLEPAEPATVAACVPEGVRDRFDRFARCPDCDRVYWEGTHHARLATLVADIQRRAG
jgi:uncharacterized protein with PIN domain